MALLEYVSAQIADAIIKRRNADALRASEQKHRKLSFELTQSNGMKDLLLDIITHDLKNPAGVIHGVADMMTKDDPDNEMVHMIKGSSQSLLKVISNATTLSKVSMDEEIQKEDLNLHELIGEILSGFKSALTFNAIQETNNIPKDQHIHANPIIEEVFKNYISNAIKYAAHGKKIVVDCELSDKFIDIFVKDFGTTIAEDKRESIFIRNLQLSDTRGRGLGLAIVKRIAESHGGSVWVEPNQPNGNVFAVRLPL
ncbi:MAG: HAMP domain-containing histidine kinase [Candidatus Marinimicrobia bacterium]|nr:HAMP domain-containing histidine kinase [Candidatus Neomarinimicrobiota bacterium]